MFFRFFKIAKDNIKKTPKISKRIFMVLCKKLYEPTTLAKKITKKYQKEIKNLKATYTKKSEKAQ